MTANLVALYDFEENTGTVAHDTSGVQPPLDLSWTLPDATPPVHWVGGGLAFGGIAQVATAGPATKIIDACKASDEITIEAWLIPANVTQDGPARIVTLSGDTLLRNFTLGQIDSTFEVRLRSSDATLNGLPSTATNNNVVEANKLQHVVFTRSNVTDEVTIYVDGAIKTPNSAKTTGTFDNWDGAYKFGIGNEFGDARPWAGEVHLVAIYSRALTGDEVKQNRFAGVH